MPEYWERYINLVPDVELPQAFDDSIRQLESLNRNALGPIAGKTYSPGKWTIKDIVQAKIGDTITEADVRLFTTLARYDSDLITINVNSVNDEPAGTDNTVTTNEDTTYTFTAADFGFTDPNDTPANALAAVKITTVATDGKLKLGGVDVTPGQLIPVAAINAGNLKFFPDANESGSPYATFTFQVQDDGGTANGGVDLDPSANTMTGSPAVRFTGRAGHGRRSPGRSPRRSCRRRSGR